MRFALLIVASITVASPAHAGSGGAFVPPVEVDVGVGAPVGPAIERLGPSTEVLAGVHWASLAWRPTRLDVGVGYVGSFRRIDDPVRSRARELAIHGGYFTLATTVARASHWRTWVAARGELLRASDGLRARPALGGALRISTELFGATASGGRKAIVLGTLAIGVYVEATYRDLPADLGPLGLTSGVTCRLPLVVIGG